MERLRFQRSRNGRLALSRITQWNACAFNPHAIESLRSQRSRNRTLALSTTTQRNVTVATFQNWSSFEMLMCNEIHMWNSAHVEFRSFFAWAPMLIFQWFVTRMFTQVFPTTSFSSHPDFHVDYVFARIREFPFSFTLRRNEVWLSNPILSTGKQRI